jgi:hypothetical protein
MQEKKEKKRFEEKITATRGNVTNINADERTKARRRDQVTLSRTFATTNDIPTRGTTEQEFAPFRNNFVFLLDLLLSFGCRHFPFTPARATVKKVFMEIIKKKYGNDRSNG